MPHKTSELENGSKYCILPGMNKMNYITLPIALTLIRLIVSPLVLPILIVYLLPYDCWPINVILTVLFAGLSLTDFFDGYLARKYNMTSKIGSSLDNIADKFLTYCTFVALLAIGKIYFLWVIIFIGRDFLVMGLRQIALENNFSLPVDYIGKVKTMTQLLLLTWLIVRPMHPSAALAYTIQNIETILLSAAILFTFLSGYHYFTKCFRQLKGK